MSVKRSIIEVILRDDIRKLNWWYYWMLFMIFF